MLKAYVELTKPERTFANVITAFAGYLFASKWHFHWTVFVALIIGSTLIIASACVFNNYTDQSMDRKMKRTKHRVLVAGNISVRAALIFATGLGVLGFVALAYTNWLTFGIGWLAFVSYVVFYDLAKRYSVFSTLIGTIPGAASLVAGYTAVSGHLDYLALLLFIIMVCWQMAHFYAIAIYRVKDYKQAKLPIWSVTYGIPSTKRQIYLFIAAFILANALLGIGYNPFLYSYIVVMGVVGGYWLYRAAKGFEVRTDDTQWARGIFSLSLVVLLVFAGMLSIAPLLT